MCVEGGLGLLQWAIWRQRNVPPWVWVWKSQAVSWCHLVVVIGFAVPALKRDARTGRVVEWASLGSWAVSL